MNYRKLLLLLLVVPMVSLGQERQVKKSNTNYDKLAYIDAQKMYLNIANKGYGSQELYENLGDTYYYNNDYINANKWYAKVFEYDAYGVSKEYYFKYIQTLKSTGNYDKADEMLELYAKAKGEDQYVKNYLSNKNYMDLIDLQSGRYEIKNLKMNTKSQDFGTSLVNGGKQVLFASSQDSSFMVKVVHKWTDREFLNVYRADVDSASGEIVNMEKLDNDINTRFHESNAIYTKDNQTIYFTRNNFLRNRFRTSSDDINKLKIYRATRKGEDGSWGKVEELSINGDEFSTAHPALNSDESRLYFASDRPGSKKGLLGETLSDIWYVDIDTAGVLGTPVNLKSINTQGNEMFPYMSENGDLYFASTGHQGLGGLDVFMVKTEEGLPSGDVINLGRPINGTHDDFAFVINDVTKKGYFSSNRPSGRGLDDIYSLTQLKPLACKVDVSGVVTDSKTNELLPNAMVSLLDENNQVIEKIQVGADAYYSFELSCSTNYSIKAEKETYSVAQEYVQTPSEIASIDQPLSVAKSVKDKINNIQVGDDLAKALNINMIYFDFDKSNIREDAEIELQKVLLFMETYPTVKIDIRSHTDSRANDAYNVKLSDRRAKSTRAYLIMKGISPERLTAQGYGEFRLVNECSNGVECSEEQHQLNRRSEFIIVEK